MNCIGAICPYYRCQKDTSGEWFALCEYNDQVVDDDCECPKVEEKTMAESVKYYEAVVNVSGTTKLGVYARSDEEAEKLLNEHLDYFGVDEFSSDLDLDVCEVVSIEKSDKRYASEIVNDKDDFVEGTNG